MVSLGGSSDASQNTTPTSSCAAGSRGSLSAGCAKSVTVNGESVPTARAVVGRVTSCAATGRVLPVLHCVIFHRCLSPPTNPSPVCDSYVRPMTLVHICDECSFGQGAGRCIICSSHGELMYCIPADRSHLGRILLHRVCAARERPRWMSEDYQSRCIESGCVLREKEVGVSGGRVMLMPGNKEADSREGSVGFQRVVS